MDSGRCKIIFDGDSYFRGGLGGNPGSSVKFSLNDSLDHDVTLVMNGKLEIYGSSDDDNKLFSPNANGALLHVINFSSPYPACSNSDILPSASVHTCLSKSQQKYAAYVNMEVGTDDNYNFAAVSVKGLLTAAHLEGLTIYAYYGVFSSECSVTYISAIAAQGFSGGCVDGTNFYSFLEVPDNGKDFGDVHPVSGGGSGSGYNIIDYRRAD